MGHKTEETQCRMVLMVQLARSHWATILHTCFKRRIRLVASSTSCDLAFKRPPEAMAARKSTAAIGSGPLSFPCQRSNCSCW
ncbi:hypothetical protein HanRHA438_Chr07g0310831 [Helianthus annuus]|nr:hypothetical protein HanRHA438_Chr07g0310831 [Helianthus annuus]